jgi:hypothetical protein
MILIKKIFLFKKLLLLFNFFFFKFFFLYFYFLFLKDRGVEWKVNTVEEEVVDHGKKKKDKKGKK